MGASCIYLFSNLGFLQAALRLAQLEYVTEQLARHVMEHHEKMGKLSWYGSSCGYNQLF